MKQQDMILSHLQDYGKITSWTAFQDYGITRLSAVIYDLRKNGYNITSNQGFTINRYNKKVYFAIYKLEK